MLAILVISFSHFILNNNIQPIDYNIMIQILLNNNHNYIVKPGIDLYSNFISKYLVEDYPQRRSQFQLLKQELIEKNMNNKLILNKVNTLTDLKEGSVLMLDQKVGCIITPNELIEEGPYQQLKMRLLEFGDNHIFSIIKDTGNYISDEILKKWVYIEEQYPKIKKSEWIDYESGMAYNQNRQNSILEYEGLLKARLQLDEVTTNIGTQIQVLDPNFNINIFKEAVYLDQLSPIQTEVMNTAIEFVNMIV